MNEPTYTIPASVTSALAQVQDAGEAFAEALIPVVVAIGIAMLGVWMGIKLFRFFRAAVGR